MRAIYFDSCGPKAHRSQWLFDFDLCSNVAIVDFFMKYRRYVYESVNTSTTNVIKEMPFMRVLLYCVIDKRHNCEESQHNFYSIRLSERNICLNRAFSVGSSPFDGSYFCRVFRCHSLKDR